MNFEVWSDAGCTEITVGTTEQIAEYRCRDLLGDNPKLLYEIQAATWEEAMAVHHIRMGWEPYRPVGEAAPCPNGCGALFYPKGTGWCRNCGSIA